MPPKTAIQFRLRTALYIAGAFSFFLTAYFAISYISIKHSLTSRSDREVYQQCDSILSSLHSQPDEREFIRIASLHSATGEAAIGLKLVRFDMPSKILETFGPSPLRSLLDSQTFIPKELPIDVQIGKTTIRILSRSNSIFTLFAAINTIAFHEVFSAMLQTYIILLITGILASFLIGMLTAGFALKPLKILVTSALEIKNESEGIAHELPTDTKTAEINELAAVINDILRARDRNIAALRDFTADAAHELRTPLTILKGELEVDLRTKSLTAIDKAAIESNLEEVQRLIRIVEDLLTLARAEQSSGMVLKSNQESWRLSDLIMQIIQRLQPLSLQKEIRIIFNNDQDLSLKLPMDDVERVIENILLNAIQYSPQGKTIEISCSKNEEHFILSIKDHGAGLKEEEIEHIFDRFWRADVSRSRKEGGTGLGLTIAKKISDRLGMQLHCKSIYEVGTTMDCIFPLA